MNYQTNQTGLIHNIKTVPVGIIYSVIFFISQIQIAESEMLSSSVMQLPVGSVDLPLGDEPDAPSHVSKKLSCICMYIYICEE